MFLSNKSSDAVAKLAALDKSQAIIEFAIDGKILTANANFLGTMGYTLEEIRGQHHRIFVEKSYADSSDYREFWARLARGEYQAAQYKRLGKAGKEVWIEASYNPIFNWRGKPIKVVKFATDVSKQKTEFADLRGKVDAIGRSQAVIEFELDGTIITANDAFLQTLGYSLADVKGRHHSMFIDSVSRSSHEYRQFWDALRAGQYQAAQYKRIGNGGKEVWIEASYNPILDLNGKPYKVVKFATDLTKRKDQNALLAKDFENGVQATVKAVALSSGNMKITAQTLAAAAEQTSQQQPFTSPARFSDFELTQGANQIR